MSPEEQKAKIKAIMAKIKRHQKAPVQRIYPNHRLHDWHKTGEYIKCYRWANMVDAPVPGGGPKAKQFNCPTFDVFVNLHGELIA